MIVSSMLCSSVPILFGKKFASYIPISGSLLSSHFFAHFFHFSPSLSVSSSSFCRHFHIAKKAWFSRPFLSSVFCAFFSHCAYFFMYSSNFVKDLSLQIFLQSSDPLRSMGNIPGPNFLSLYLSSL